MSSSDAPHDKWSKWPGDLDLWTLKLVSESRVTWATSVPILVFLGLSVVDLGPLYATDTHTSDVNHLFMSPPKGWGTINSGVCVQTR